MISAVKSAKTGTLSTAAREPFPKVASMAQIIAALKHIALPASESWFFAVEEHEPASERFIKNA
jgi:hypothetical protein